MLQAMQNRFLARRVGTGCCRRVLWQCYATAAPEPRQYKVGQLVTGTITKVNKTRAEMALDSAIGLIPVDAISNKHVPAANDIFSVDEQVTAIVMSTRQPGLYMLSTRKLEANPGDMWTNKQAVYAGAAQKAQEMLDVFDVRAAKRAQHVATLKVGDQVTVTLDMVKRVGTAVLYEDVQYYLVPGSQLGAVQPGDQLQVKVANVSPSRIVFELAQ